MDNDSRSRLQFMLSHFSELVDLYPQAHKALRFMESRVIEVNEALNVKQCKQCGKAFLQKGYTQRTLFCCSKCKDIWHNHNKK
ncbi:hypothetical protein LCGC14_1184090 [marine sediment metagenome]|uniref:Uncharacterized protein n=1 Tax=marine sediment metagenome TaxID=412755 RepID=A0A0F9LLE1_9ZZZZ|nr:hypothetical protein [Candidatus Aminicenantes bacterium]